MVQRQEKTSTSSFARGSELWMHQFRLLVVALRTVFLASAVVALLIGGGYFWASSSADQRYVLERNVVAKLRSELSMTAAKMDLHVDGQLRQRDHF